MLLRNATICAPGIFSVLLLQVVPKCELPDRDWNDDDWPLASAEL
jgi:hypothetical protein